MRQRAFVLLALAFCLGCGQQAPAASNAAAGSGGSGPGAAGASSAAGNQSAAGISGSTGEGATGGGAAGSSTGGVSAGSGGSAGEAGADKLSDCELAFPYIDEEPRGHWLGADSNFSVVLGGGRGLMTFQDTFVGGPVTTERNGSAMVGNSVAALSCQTGTLAVEYAWGGAAQEHAAMFADQNGERLWIHRPWLYEGKLFLTATRVSSEGAVFEEHGITLARVQNPLDPPATWTIEYFNLTDQRLTVGKGIAESDEHVYFFTPHQANMILARIAKPKLVEPTISEASLEYLGTDGNWAAGLVPASAKKLGIPANTGLTVRYHAGSQRWLALYTNTSGWPSATISVSSAASLEGPWSQPSDVYSVPEMDEQAPEYDADTICYGASEHDAFNSDPDGQLLFTYTCNSNDFEKLLANMAIYVPRVVTRPNPLVQ